MAPLAAKINLIFLSFGTIGTLNTNLHKNMPKINPIMAWVYEILIGLVSAKIR